jgi:hypothetical protein
MNAAAALWLLAFGDASSFSGFTLSEPAIFPPIGHATAGNDGFTTMTLPDTFVLVRHVQPSGAQRYSLLDEEFSASKYHGIFWTSSGSLYKMRMRRLACRIAFPLADEEMADPAAAKL